MAEYVQGPELDLKLVNEYRLLIISNIFSPLWRMREQVKEVRLNNLFHHASRFSDKDGIFTLTALISKKIYSFNLISERSLSRLVSSQQYLFYYLLNNVSFRLLTCGRVLRGGSGRLLSSRCRFFGGGRLFIILLVLLLYCSRRCCACR